MVASFPQPQREHVQQGEFTEPFAQAVLMMISVSLDGESHQSVVSKPLGLFAMPSARMKQAVGLRKKQKND